MKSLVTKTKNALIMAGIQGSEFIKRKVIQNQRGEAGVGTVLGIVFIIVVFAFIIVPQGRQFMNDLFSDLVNWYNGLNLFPTS